jgi:anti-anti-sigma regulatory factor
MAMTAECIELEKGRAVPVLEEALQKLDAADHEMVLDLSFLRRMDAGGLRALEALASAAEKKNVKLALRGVGIEVYKVLKLMKLAPRFSFLP